MPAHLYYWWESFHSEKREIGRDTCIIAFAIHILLSDHHFNPCVVINPWFLRILMTKLMFAETVPKLNKCLKENLSRAEFQPPTPLPIPFLLVGCVDNYKPRNTMLTTNQSKMWLTRSKTWSPSFPLSKNLLVVTRYRGSLLVCLKPN